MKGILNFLNEPIPYGHKKWLIVVIPPVWVFLLLYILEPYGISMLPDKLKTISVITLIITITCAIVTYIFPVIFKGFYNADNWKRYKFLIVGIMIPALAMPFISYYLYYALSEANIPAAYNHNHLQKTIIWFLIGAFIGTFPTVAVYTIMRHFWGKMKTEERGISNHPSDDEEKEHIITILSNTKDKLKINPQDVLYAEVQGNYVTIYYLKNSQIEHKSLRITLSQIMETLADYPHIVRSHRAFIINASHAISIQASLNTYTIRLYNTNIEIPISRSYLKSIRKIIE